MCIVSLRLPQPPASVGTRGTTGVVRTDRMYQMHMGNFMIYFMSPSALSGVETELYDRAARCRRTDGCMARIYGHGCRTVSSQKGICTAVIVWAVAIIGWTNTGENGRIRSYGSRNKNFADCPETNRTTHWARSFTCVFFISVALIIPVAQLAPSSIPPSPSTMISLSSSLHPDHHSGTVCRHCCSGSHARVPYTL
jgi:hypothetical protein